jgi:two-component system, OmpR family, response regulator
MSPTIIVIEDDKEIQQYIAKVLNDHGYTVYPATTASEGMKLVGEISPDLVLLDLDLPDVRGETVCKELKEDYPELKIIMLTGMARPEDMARGLDLGADDYIPKPFSADVLLARVKARLREVANGDKVLKVGDLSLDPKTHQVRRGEKPIDLSPQEFKLLHYFMHNPNQVLTREMILSRIWGMSPDVETRVVDVYVGYLRRKIDKTASNKLLHSVRGFGYMLKDEGQAVAAKS